MAADCMPADTSFPAWVVMRGLVEEMQTAADPSVALGMLGDLTATGMPAHVALASTPGAVTALLDVLKSDDDGSNAEIARSLLAACVHADPAMCGPAVLGNDVAKPIVGLFIAWLEDEELEPYANAFCVALLAISESRAWITSSCAQTNGGRPSIEESEDDDDTSSSWSDDAGADADAGDADANAGANEPAPRVRADGLEIVADEKFSYYIAEPLGAILRSRASAEIKTMVARALASYEIDRDGRAKLSPPLVHGRVESLVTECVPKWLGEILRRGYGGDDREGDDRDMFTLAAQSIDLLLTSKVAFAPLLDAGVVEPLARALVFAAGTIEDEGESFGEEDLFIDAGEALCSVAHYAGSTELNLPEPLENQECLSAMLNAGVAEACVSVAFTVPSHAATLVAASLLAAFATFDAGAARVAAAGGIRTLVNLLNNLDHNMRDEELPQEHEIFLAASRCCERLAGSDVREAGAELRANELVEAGVVKPLSRAVVVVVTFSEELEREELERAHLAANALGNIAEHCAARARRVLDVDEPLIGALLNCLSQSPCFGPSSLLALGELRTAAAWCLASLMGTQDVADMLWAGKSEIAAALVQFKDAAPVPAGPRAQLHTPGDIRVYLMMALGRLASSRKGRAEAIAKYPGMVSALHGLTSDDEPDTAREARAALEALGRAVPTRTLPRRKCRKTAR